MQADLALIVPAAGRGSRFARHGIAEPKPLVDLDGRPFFWWATESVRRVVPLRQIVFVVLQEHIDQFAIDRRIHAHYPAATIVALPDVTGGAAETAAIGLEAIGSPGPVAVNDCDHAFMASSLPDTVRSLQDGLDAALMCFRSDSAAYSYVRFGAANEVIGTVEKQVASPFAIAGCYLFSDPARISALYERYQRDCPYDELFMSGLFNLLAQERARIGMVELDRHCSFGTPEELGAITPAKFAGFAAWK